mgnify:CR=1 FL=1
MDKKTFLNIKIEKITHEYVITCKFIPSNIFRAFIKSKKHKSVNTKEKDLNSINSDKNENFSSVIIRLSSIRSKIEMSIIL